MEVLGSPLGSLVKDRSIRSIHRCRYLVVYNAYSLHKKDAARSAS
jgi:hypothetical protein